MFRHAPKLALLVVGLPLAACVGSNQGLTPHSNPSLYSVNEPVVERTDYVFDLSGTGMGLPGGELDRLDAWFTSMQLRYGDRIHLDQAGGVDPAARAQVAQVAARYGMLLGDGAPVAGGQLGYGTVRVIISRSSASVPDCPHWNPQEIGSRVTTSPNFGCSVNTNLANMIANPDDLVIGQAGSASVDAQTGTKAIRTYRTKGVTGAGGLKEETTGGQ